MLFLVSLWQNGILSLAVNSRLVSFADAFTIKRFQKHVNLGAGSGAGSIRLAGLHCRGASGETSHRRTYCRPRWNAFSRSCVSWTTGSLAQPPWRWSDIGRNQFTSDTASWMKSCCVKARPSWRQAQASGWKGPTKSGDFLRLKRKVSVDSPIEPRLEPRALLTR